MLTLPPPYAAIPLPLGPSGKLLDGLYAAKDLSLKGGGKGSLGFLYLYFKRLHPPEQATTWQQAQVSLGLLTYCIFFLKYTQYLSPKAWQVVYHLLLINCTPNSVSIIQPIWP